MNARSKGLFCIADCSIESNTELQFALRIYYINGRFIIAKDLINGNNTVNLEVVKPGIYLGQLTNDKGEIKHSRFVKL
jgi:hypothetical protein